MKATSANATRILIVGGGVMGCATAWRLSQSGFRVTILEKSIPGAEASSAAAGMLAPMAEAHADDALARLMNASMALYGEFSRELLDFTGIDIGYKQEGSIRVARTPEELESLRLKEAWRDPKWLTETQIQKLEPGVGNICGGLFYSEDGKVDPVLLMQAVRAAAEKSGCEFMSHAQVSSVFKSSKGQVKGVKLSNGELIEADHVIIAAGSWTNQIDGLELKKQTIIPARGQIIQLTLELPPVKRVIFAPDVYVVPREDGRCLIGSTLEFVGYERKVTAQAIQELLGRALSLIPTLKNASFGPTWCNFRPYTQDELPLLGQSPHAGLSFAAGHYRTGILLTPITAAILQAELGEKTLPLDIAAYSPGRSIPLS